MFSATVRYWLHVTQLQSEEKYLQSELVQMQAGNSYFFVILDVLSHALIGAIAIRDPLQYSGQLYSWLNEQFWGNNRYQEALQLITHYYFQQTNALYYTAHVDCANVASLKALKKFGALYGGITNGGYDQQHMLLIRNKVIA